MHLINDPHTNENGPKVGTHMGEQTSSRFFVCFISQNSFCPPDTKEMLCRIPKPSRAVKDIACLASSCFCLFQPHLSSLPQALFISRKKWAKHTKIKELPQVHLACWTKLWNPKVFSVLTTFKICCCR